MRKLTLLITSLLCYVGVLHAEALVADGVYTLSADVNKQRGELVAANEHDYPVLDGIDLSGYTQNSTAATTNGQYWYVKSAGQGDNTYYLYNIAKGKYLVNEKGNVNFGDTPYVWTFVTNAGKPAYLNIKDAARTDKVWLSSGCGRTAAQRPVQWDSNNNDGGALYTFTYVGNYFATPETGKFYTIKGDGEFPWVTANTTAGGNVVVSKNEADAAVFLKTENGLQAVATGKYLGYDGVKYTYSDTKLTIELRNTGDYLANYSNKYAIVSGGNYMFNNNTDGIVHESSQGLDLPRLWAFTEVEAPAPTVAEVNGVKYASFADAAEDAQAGDEIKLLANIEGDITVPANVTLNGNGFAVSGTITADGTITFAGVTKAGNFGVKNVNTVINIPAGASLQLIGTGRMVIGHGCTFNITGSIAENAAKTTDKATLTPSLVMPGASFTGAGVTFNVTNAYISAPSSYCSSSKSASGTFDFNINNSIWENAGKFAFESQSTAATVNFDLVESVLNTGSHLVFGVSRGEVVIDNSNVNVGKSNQIENQSTMTIKNGSVVNGAVATSSNAKNPGTVIVDNATYAVTGEFSGSDLGTGTLIIKKGANVSVGSIKAGANVTVDAEGMTAGDAINFTANLSQFTGTLSVINNDKLEAKIVDGKVVLAAKPVAKIGEQGYETLEAAFKAATSGCTIDILSDVTVDSKWDCRYTGSKFTVPVTINGNSKTIKFTAAVNDQNWNTVFRFEENATVNNLTVDISNATGAQRVISAKKSLNVDGLNIVGAARYGVIYGEGASATDLAATEIVVKNSTLGATRRAVSDNEGGKDVKSVVIEGNTFNANVYVSASESIAFNNNTVVGETDLRSYAADNVLNVQAQGNTLTADKKNYIYAKTIVAQEGFETKNPPLKVATKAELNAALAAAKDGDVITLTADIDYGTDQLAITKAITLDLGGKTLTTRNAWGGMSIKNNPTVKNGTIVHASNTAAIKVWNATAFEDLVIDVQGKGDANKTIGGIVLQSGSTTKVGSIKNVTIKGAALTNGIETYNCGDATENVIGAMENVTIDAQGTGLLISAPCGTATNCDIKGGVNAVEIFIKGNYSASLELVASTVEGGVYAHDEFSTNPDIVNNGTLKFTADEATTGADAEDVTLEIARAEAEKVQGVLNDVMLNAQAKVNNTYYATLTDAIAAAKAGDVVTVFEGTYAMPSVKAGITIVGEGNVVFEGTLSGTLENLTMKNIHIKGANAQRWAYAKGNLVFEKVTFEATGVYALHFDGITEGTNLTYKDCTIIGWAALGGSPASCVFDGCTIKDNGTYGVIRTYFDTEIKNCTFNVANANTTDAYEDGIHAVGGAKVVVNSCTNKNGDMKDLVNVNGTSVVIVDDVEIKNVAKVGDKYYATLAEAFAAVGDGADKTVELIADVDLAGAEWTPVTFNGVFDGQNHTISNLVVNGAGKSNQGFFAQTNNGEIKNVTFNNAKVTGRLNVGVVAGTPYTSKYTNVKVTGHVEVNGMAYVGGVGGKNAYANWTDITVDVDDASYVKATSTENGTAYRTYVGGVIGFNGEGGHTFKNISSNIKVIGDVMDIGGIFGILHYGNNAENITFTGAVEAPADAKEVGGIAGVWHNEKGQVVTITTAKSEGTVKVGDVSTTGSIVGGAYNASNVTTSTSGSLKIDGKEMWLSVAKIGDTTYRTLADALTAAQSGDIVNLLWAEGDAPIAMNGAVFGKDVTITGTAKVDWSKGFLFVGRGGEGNATVTFDGANLTSASNNASTGIHVSGREKNTTNKYDGTVVINNSTIELDYLINKGAMTLDNATLTVKNGFAIGGRPASETESGQDATATISLTNGSKVVVNNHNGMGLGYEAIGVMNIDATSTFETTQSFLVTAKGTMNVAGTAKVAGTLTNNGAIVLTDAAATLTSTECGNVTTSVADYKVVYADGAYKVVAKNYVAKVGDAQYETLSAALADAQAGATITLVADVTEDVTLSKAVTIEGAGKTYTGAMTLKADATIKNVNFDGKGFNGYAITTRGAQYLTIENCTAKNYGYGFVQLASATALTTVKDVTVSNVNYGVKVDYSGAVALENVDITAGVAAVLNSNYGEKTITIKNSKLNIYGTWTRNNTTKTNIVFEGDNTVDEFKHDAAIDNFVLAAEATLTAPENVVTVNAVKEYCAIYENGKYVSVKATVKAGDAYYLDLQEAIKDAAPNGTVELLADVTVDEWITISETLTIGDGSIITLKMDGLTINGNGHTLTIKEIESPEREDFLFHNATNLNVKNLTISCVGSDEYDGGISLKKGTIEDVTFNGGKYAVLPGAEGVTVTGCTFNGTTGYAIYYEEAREGIVVTDNTFNTADGAYAITMRSNEQFTNNTVETGRVNLANSATSTVTGNDFGTERFKVYNAAAATIKNNKINNLVFDKPAAVVKSTFTDNELSDEAAALLKSTAFEGGTWGGIDWTLTNDGTLTIAPTKGEPVADKNAPTKRTYKVGEWREAVIYKSNGSASAIGGYPYDVKKVKKLIIEEGVTKIGSFTAQFPNLTGEVVIPSTVTYFGQEAFHKTPITKLTFAAGGTEPLCIANGVFKKTLIEEVSFPGDRPSIEIHHWAFGGSPNLKTAYIPANLTKVWGGEHVDYFDNFNSQTNVSWTNTGSIFTGCTAMETITFETEEIRDFFFAGNRQGTPEDPMVAAADLVAYNSLDKAIAAATDDIILCKNATLKDTWTIAAGKDMTLNLNGKTLSQSKACTASYEMINNKGNLTITGNGKISFTDTSAGDPSFGWGSYTVRNEGNLVVENGTIEHKGAQAFGTHCIMAIYQYCGSTTINGGTISTPNYRSARLWKGEMTINGGTFNGQVWVQAVDNTAKLTINGGTFAPKGNDASAVFVTNSDHDVQLAVANGTFNGKIGCSDATKLAGAITGGMFTETAKNGTNAALLAIGLAFGEADANGYYAVEDDPATHYIATLDELKAFRDDVNSGANYYDGVDVYLTADIDMAGENWVAIGSATKDHGFMGNFDGQGYKIKNLTITDPALDSDGYAYAGLFGVTEGTDKDNQNTIKNLIIENVTITTTGHIAAAAIAYPYYTIVDNVKVCGKIAIEGGDYTAGVLAYTRRCVNASNLAIVGNDGSYVKGAKTVGGVISDIQMNGGLTAAYSNFSAEGLTITGEKQVGGISGIICKQTLNGASVKNVTLNCSNASVGIVSGSWGDVSTISNVTVENVSGATAIIGATWKEGAAVEAKIGDTYYATLEAAYKAAQAGATVELLAPVVIASGETLTLDKDVTVVYTSNVAGEDMFTNRGTLNISAGTITYANTDTTASNVTVSTISSEPGSVLNITGGTVENKTVKADGSSIYSYAIDMLTNGSLGDVTATISGGTVSSDYMAIRQFNNGDVCKNTLTITGGYIYGAKRAVQVHFKNNAAYTTISGGKIEADGDYTLCFLTTSENLSVSGGEFIGAVWYSGSKGFISGGTYNNPVEAAYCAEGYMPNKNANGTYGVVAAQDAVAAVGGFAYGTLKAAVAAAKAGETITLLQNVKENVTISKNLTLDGADKTLTGMITTDGKSLKVTIKNVEFNGNNGTINYAMRADDDLNLVVEDCSVKDYLYGFLYANKSNDKIVVKNVTVENCAEYGAYLVAFNSASFENFTVKGQTKYGVVVANAGARTVNFKNVSFEDAETPLHINEIGKGKVTFNFSGVNEMSKEEFYTSKYVVVVAEAQVGTKVCGSLQDAIAAAVTGETVTLLTDLNLGWDDVVKTSEGFTVLSVVEGKNITLDMNGKKITVDHQSTTDRIYSVIFVENGAGLTVTGDGSIEIDADDNAPKVAYMFWKRGSTGYLVIENGNFYADNTEDSMVYSNGSGIVTVNGGTFTLEANGTRVNGFPWIFNVVGTNAGYVNVNGGTYNYDISKQFYAAEVKIGSGYTVRDNGDDTWSVVTGITLVDGEFTEYTNDRTEVVEYISYTRTMSTDWNAFYVPFEVPVSLLAEHFEVAYINGVRRSDYDENGVIDDKLNMELIMIHGGKGNADGKNKVLKANYPYFVRAKGDEKKVLTIELTDVTLYAAENVTYDCSTFSQLFEITGNASQVYINSSENAIVYGVNTTGQWTKITKGSNLKPFRFFMTVTNRDGSAPTTEEAPAMMSIAIRGEELEDGTTIIYDVEMDGDRNADYIFDLQGRRVLEPQKGNLYIINGKKVIF